MPVTSKKGLRREALARREMGAPLPGDDELLAVYRHPRQGNMPVVPAHEAAAWADKEENDPVAYSGLSEEIRALLDRRVPEPEVRTFSHVTVQEMALAGATAARIALLMGIDVAVLKKEAKAALELGRTQYQFLLGHQQTRAALAGDRVMLVWKGKQDLGQSDKVSTEHTGTIGLADVSADAADTRKLIEQRRAQRALVSGVPLAVAEPIEEPATDDTLPAWRNAPVPNNDDPDYESPAEHDTVQFTDRSPRPDDAL